MNVEAVKARIAERKALGLTAEQYNQREREREAAERYELERPLREAAQRVREADLRLAAKMRDDLATITYALFGARP